MHSSSSIIDDIKALSENLPDDAKMLKDEKMHITLVDRHILQPHRNNIKKLIKDNKFPQFLGKIIMENNLVEEINEDLKRKSWVVNINNQQELRDYVNFAMEIL